MREVTVAVVQMNTTLGEPDPNLAKMSDFVRKITSAQKVDLIVFPELATTGYECGVKFTQLTQRVPGPNANMLAQRAQETGTHIAFGMPSKERVESIYFNSSVLVGPEGDVMMNYRKLHLRGEQQIQFRPGFRLEPVETPLGIVGLQDGLGCGLPRRRAQPVFGWGRVDFGLGGVGHQVQRRVAHVYFLAGGGERLLCVRGQPHRRGTGHHVLRREHDRWPARPGHCGFGRDDRGLHHRQD